MNCVLMQDLRIAPERNPSGRMAAAAYAAKPSRRSRRVTPEACLRHDASEGKKR